VAAQLAAPVVLKADVAGLVHKSDAGAVQLDLHGGDEVRAGYRALAERFGTRMSAAVIQPMITGGTEVIIGVVQEPVFGPLVVFGLGGVATDVLSDRSARLTPLTDTGAAALIRSVRAAPLLLGHRGTPPADLAALQNTLLRVSRLADDLPQVAELDLNPVPRHHRPPILTTTEADAGRCGRTRRSRNPRSATVSDSPCIFSGQEVREFVSG
jgi:acyl-CoA synthetase (NDP forming)